LYVVHALTFAMPSCQDKFYSGSGVLIPGNIKLGKLPNTNSYMKTF